MIVLTYLNMNYRSFHRSKMELPLNHCLWKAYKWFPICTTSIIPTLQVLDARWAQSTRMIWRYFYQTFNDRWGASQACTHISLPLNTIICCIAQYSPSSGQNTTLRLYATQKLMALQCNMTSILQYPPAIIAQSRGQEPSVRISYACSLRLFCLKF